jgi:predicted helicase
MRHLDGQHNLALLVSQQQITEGFAHIFVTRVPADWGSVSNKSRESTSAFPLYLRRTGSGQPESELFGDLGFQNNLTAAFMESLTNLLKTKTVEARQAFDYCYAVLHSPSYRSRYASLLKSDFPRLPLTRSLELFRTLAQLGDELVALHLLESPKLSETLTILTGPRNAEIEKISYSRDTVWLDKAQTRGFRGIPETVWNFRIGCYQVCEKWLKDRKGRTLSNEDINHYHRIIVALAETTRIMAEIDKTIDAHGGWPGAFAN